MEMAPPLGGPPPRPHLHSSQGASPHSLWLGTCPKSDSTAYCIRERPSCEETAMLAAPVCLFELARTKRTKSTRCRLRRLFSRLSGVRERGARREVQALSLDRKISMWRRPPNGRSSYRFIKWRLTPDTRSLYQLRGSGKRHSGSSLGQQNHTSSTRDEGTSCFRLNIETKLPLLLLTSNRWRQTQRLLGADEFTQTITNNQSFAQFIRSSFLLFCTITGRLYKKV